MRLLKALLLIVIVLAAVFAIGGWLLPDRTEMERSVVIERSPPQMFELLDGFGRFNEWSPWRDYDATAAYEYAGPARGVGAIMRWQGEKGGGAQEIIASDPPHSITVQLDFGADGKALASWLLRPAGDGTRVTWRLESDAEGSWVGRWFNLLLDRMVGPDYERGLADLKVLAEAEPPAPIAPPVPEEAPQEPMSDDDAAAPEAGDADAGTADPAAAG